MQTKTPKKKNQPVRHLHGPGHNMTLCKMMQEQAKAIKIDLFDRLWQESRSCVIKGRQ